MELTGFPFWKLTYDDDFKIAGHLTEAQDFVREHEVSSISFYVNVMEIENRKSQAWPQFFFLPLDWKKEK